MIRKQLYIEEEQDRALKRRARELGVSEAELVRRALAVVLREDQIVEPPPLDRVQVLRALLADARVLAKNRIHFDAPNSTRDELYAGRVARWLHPET